MPKKPIKKSKGVNLNINISIGKVSLTQKAVFAKHLSVMLKAGLTINEALEIAEESSKGKMKSILAKVRSGVESGNSLADSFEKYPKVFSRLFIDVTRAGEKSGSLSENLENVAMQIEKERQLVSKVKSAAAYPTVILVAAFFLALGMAYYVLPQITPLFSGLDIELPITTRMVIWFSDLMRDSGGRLLLGIFIGFSFISWLAKQKFSQPVTHWLTLHLPIISKISHNSNLARFSLTLGTLLKSGLTIDEALEITKRTVPNYYYRKFLTLVGQRIERGSTMSVNLAKKRKLFPRLVTSMVHVGEESGQLDESLLYLAEYYEGEVDTATKTLTTALEPILLIVIGLVVGTLALSIITPIYEITGNVRR
jgi:type IV pilus assembly protein PilC